MSSSMIHFAPLYLLKITKKNSDRKGRKMYQQTKLGFQVWGAILLAVFAVAITLTLTRLVFAPANRAIDREVVQQSQQYNETKLRLLNDLWEDVLELDVEILEASNLSIAAAKQAQRLQLVRQMRQEMQLMAEQEIPEELRIFMTPERQK